MSTSTQPSQEPLFTEWCAAVRKAGITSLFLVERPDLRQWTAFVTLRYGATREIKGTSEEAVLLAVVGWRP